SLPRGLVGRGRNVRAPGWPMNRLLVLAYPFPPCSVSGTHRTLAFVKYLARERWHSTVVCARNPVDPERDWSLLSQVPEGTEVVRTIDLNLPALRERFRKRPSAESRDAWVSNPFGDIPFDRLRAWNARAEAETARAADAIVCVVETMREDFLHRYPERHAEDIVTIPNGFDPEDFEDLWAGKQGIGSIA